MLHPPDDRSSPERLDARTARHAAARAVHAGRTHRAWAGRLVIWSLCVMLGMGGLGLTLAGCGKKSPRAPRTRTPAAAQQEAAPAQQEAAQAEAAPAQPEAVPAQPQTAPSQPALAPQPSKAQAPATEGATRGAPAMRDTLPPDYGSGPAPGSTSAPGTVGATPEGEKLAWGTDFGGWYQVTGYVLSQSHGTRFAMVRATPLASAETHIFDSDLVRHKREGFKPYPVGTTLAMQTWEVSPDLSRGAPGPIFFMRKEAPGYDPDGGDWRYAMTRPDLTVLAEGKDGHASDCRSCHQGSRARDFVPAVDR